MIGFIYKLTCSLTGDTYYGSTIDPYTRYRKHLSKNNNCTSNKLLHPVMEIMDTVECSKKDLLLLEKNYILNNTCINKKVPLRNNKEYYYTKKIKNPFYLKELYQRGEGKMRNLRTRMHCECGGKYVKRNFKIHEKTMKHKNYISKL